MGIIRKIIDEIKIPFIKWRVGKCKCVIFMPFSRTDSQTIFEGNNRLGKKVKLKRSHLGFGSYIAAETQLENVFLGRYCSIGSHVQIINGKHPTREIVSTHPAFYSINNVTNFTYVQSDTFRELDYVKHNDKLYDVVVGNDVWIGNNVLIMAGVTIGDGAIIGAGAVVTKDIEPYAIAAGVPAKILRKRFSDQQVQFLEELKWWDQGQEWIESHAKYFENIDDFISKIRM